MKRSTLLLTVAASVAAFAGCAQAQSSNAAPMTVKAETSKMTKQQHGEWTALLQNYVSAPDGVGLTHFDGRGRKIS